MALKDVWTVQITRTEHVEVIVSDATEDDIWKQIDDGMFYSEYTRDQYEALSDEAKAKFLGECALCQNSDLAGIDTTGERFVITDAFIEDDEQPEEER